MSYEQIAAALQTGPHLTFTIGKCPSPVMEGLASNCKVVTIWLWPALVALVCFALVAIQIPLLYHLIKAITAGWPKVLEVRRKMREEKKQRRY